MNPETPSIRYEPPAASKAKAPDHLQDIPLSREELSDLIDLSIRLKEIVEAETSRDSR